MYERTLLDKIHNRHLYAYHPPDAAGAAEKIGGFMTRAELFAGKVDKENQSAWYQKHKGQPGGETSGLADFIGKQNSG